MPIELMNYNNKMNIIDLGLVKYEKAWQIQKELFNQKIQNKINGISNDFDLIVCEHYPVYTFGKSANIANSLVTKDFLKENEVDSFEIERGGDITFHGPQQLVVYPIFDLDKINIGVKKYVFNIEECIIQTLQEFGIKSDRIDNKIGIWVGKNTENERKIAAIGIKCSRFITMHGLALNVNTDMKYFDWMIPCGLTNRQVSSMEKELKEKIDIEIVKKTLISKFFTTFEL